MQDLSQPVLKRVATQVGVLPIPLDGYPQHENTRNEHCEDIRQLARARRDRKSLRRQLCCYDDASSCSHVQSQLWTVGFLRQRCGHYCF